MPEGFLTEIDDEILVSVIETAKTKKIGDFDKDGQPVKSYGRYLEQLVRYATGEDSVWEDPESLLVRAGAVWAHAQTRKPNESKIALRVEGGKGWKDRRLVLDIVTDDKPFLVDSISAALADAGKPLSFFSNAVIDIRRDAKGKRQFDGKGKAVRESLIHAEMDPPVSDADIDRLTDDLKRVLEDVGAAVEDWEPMRARLASCISQLEKTRITGVEREDQRESIDFLKWLWDNRFAFLGVRAFAYSDDDETRFEAEEGKDLGIFKHAKRQVLRSTYTPSGEIAPAVRDFLASKEPIVITKSSSVSLVHRRVYMDYVGVKVYSPDGVVIGEELFVGLFTADAYNRPATDIPLIRAKLHAVLDSTAFDRGGHNEKALSNILETYPRDELFQIDADTLRDTCLGILRLFKRPRAKLFIRRDRFDRFVSAIAFIPRDRFNSDIRSQIGDLLATTYNGNVTSFSPFFGDAALVRVHFIIGIGADAPDGPGARALTAEVRKICRSWSDDLLEAMRRAHDGALPAALYEKYEDAFGPGYIERAEIADTLRDIGALEQLTDNPAIVRAYRKAGDPAHTVRLKIYRRGGPFPLSRLIPTIENMGLSVMQEAGHDVEPAGAKDDVMWIHDFHTEQQNQLSVDLDDVRQGFEAAMLSVLAGLTEDDRFNALVLTAGVTWREAWILRAAAKYHVQAGFSYSQSYMEDALLNHPAIARGLIAAFHARFNPAGAKDAAKREKDAGAAAASVLDALNDVQSLAEDRIFRRFLNLFSSILRTNYYQPEEDGAAKAYISFKIDSAQIDDLPEPRPYREIFVSGPRVDGVHLRFGPVARGGLRWSDRREDFRTEILGLVKAQRVKNAVIVPTGSKGGFYPKQLPQTDDRAAIYEEGRESYKLFIRGLLDLTDNIIKGEVIRPKTMVLWDDPDPYLVVAADKGTAAFSDTANAISEEYGFWLGDAFASGGSAGYDHKIMGITARGAWEAVKRHFREMGKDIQSEPFTAAGVGDMSGDVFGNGMLLSEQTKLIAAFDHRDIFIDPDPDPAKSFAERKRMFELPRSSWAEYDKKLISKGGGVFSRAAKSISTTPEMRALLNIADEKMAPNDLIQAILKMPVELFWLGGIGTYFKAETEENWRVGDRTNDPLRINAKDAGAQVIGEGANLGLTQFARIEFARAGGRINTDAIDNSAGVDSSDHEVNIKILLSSAIEQAELKAADRNELLASMTDDVADHVLRHNYDQTRAITFMESTAARDVDVHTRLMSTMERAGRLDRTVENLPANDEMFALRQQGLGLTRPELSVLLAYAKLWVFDALVQSNAPDDPTYERELFAYFPEALKSFTKPIVSHQLRREIIATRVSNEIMDTCGVSFLQRTIEMTGGDFPSMALAYETARGVYELAAFANAIDALDNKASAVLQTELYLEASYLLREQVFHLLNDPEFETSAEKHGVKSIIQKYRTPVTELKKALPNVLGAAESEALAARVKHWRTQGATAALAKEAASLPLLEHTFDIVDLGSEAGWSNPGVAALYFAVGREYYFDALRDKARKEPPADHFDRISVRQFAEDLGGLQRALTKKIIAFAGNEPKGSPGGWGGAVIARWDECSDGVVAAFHSAVGELDLAGPASVGKFALFAKRVSGLIDDRRV